MTSSKVITLVFSFTLNFSVDVSGLNKKVRLFVRALQVFNDIIK